MVPSYYELTFKYYSRGTQHVLRYEDGDKAWKKWEDLSRNPDVASLKLKEITVLAGGDN